jgi:hypothetical protein
MTTREYTILGIALSGWYGRTTEGAHVSSYDKRIETQYAALVDGGVVVDKRPAFDANLKGAIKEVMDGPLLDMSLAPEAEERCPEPSDILLYGLEDTFQRWAKKRATDKGWKGLDSVGLEVYLRRWRALGARIGVRHGDTIHWEDGEEVAIQRE